jgi:hypothetical protein
LSCKGNGNDGLENVHLKAPKQSQFRGVSLPARLRENPFFPGEINGSVQKRRVVMDKSPKHKDRHDDGHSSYHQQSDDGGRGQGDTGTGNSVVPDVKGGTGDQGGGGDPEQAPDTKPSV